MRGLTVFFGAVACASLWFGLVAPAILRNLGIPIAGGIWRMARRNQHLSRTQYIWSVGVFSWGIGMFLFSTLWNYLDWRLFLNYKAWYANLGDIVERLLAWMAAGWLVGFFGAPKRRHAERVN